MVKNDAHKMKALDFKITSSIIKGEKGAIGPSHVAHVLASGIDVASVLDTSPEGLYPPFRTTPDSSNKRIANNVK